MITDGKPFDTNVFFSGGAGMFLQYHDIVKPVYLYAMLKMMVTQETFGLPTYILQNMSILSLVEWYIKRRYKNPLQCLDFKHCIDKEELDKILQEILITDESIYKLCPSLNISKLLHVYRTQHMMFPIYVYSEYDEPFIKNDLRETFRGIECHYFFGDLKQAISRCDQNFTYIFSDIEMVKSASEILMGTCSHVLLANEYRYNYIDNCKTFKYNLMDMMTAHPFIRIGTTLAMDPHELARSFASNFNI